MEDFISSKTHELQHLEENNDDNNRVESEPIIEPQPVVTNPFVTKC
ncbi:3264_t:CDS:1, partial [Racocetra persica]